MAAFYEGSQHGEDASAEQLLEESESIMYQDDWSPSASGAKASNDNFRVGLLAAWHAWRVSVCVEDGPFPGQPHARTWCVAGRVKTADRAVGMHACAVWRVCVGTVVCGRAAAVQWAGVGCYGASPRVAHCA